MLAALASSGARPPVGALKLQDLVQKHQSGSALKFVSRISFQRVSRAKAAASLQPGNLSMLACFSSISRQLELGFLAAAPSQVTAETPDECLSRPKPDSS